ncbi:MAG: hypothetical protein QXF56_03210 [Candidatus Micrarchaeia archaeon]
MPETATIEERERIKTAIGDLGRGGIPTLEAAKFLLREVEIEFVKERSKEKSFRDAVKEMGRMSREDRINEVMLKLGGIVVSMEITYGGFRCHNKFETLQATMNQHLCNHEWWNGYREICERYLRLKSESYLNLNCIIMDGQRP